MTQAKKAVLLMNIGSPDSYKTKDVARYLRQFLYDGRVINIPAFFRFLLVYGIIVPFRASKSAKKYKEIWTEKGSPLIYHSVELQKKLQVLMKDEADIYIGMRYGNPNISDVLREMQTKYYSEIILLPMYPQNASSTTSSSIQLVFNKVKKWVNIPSFKIISEFWNHPLYIKALVQNMAKFNLNAFDHVVISFHGLPMSQVYQSHKCESCTVMNCAEELNNKNKFCYRTTCIQTALNLANELGLPNSSYSIGFQSRLSKNWLSPFTDAILIDLAQHDKKKVLVICLSFVADCLETLHEIEIEYAEMFKEKGGEELVLVPALNSEDFWVDAVRQMLQE
jgi:ferrochelatase